MYNCIPTKPVFILILLGLLSPTIQSQERSNRNTRFDQWDKNMDGKLTKSELPPGLRTNFSRVDRDGDGFISRLEDAAFLRRNSKKTNPNQNQGGRLPNDVKVERDLPYVVNGHQRQKLDLYYWDKNISKTPKEPGPRPLVIWIHGGGWRAGSKNNCPATFLLHHGFNVASINYRLSGHAISPAQIQDCKAAIRWLKTNAKKFGINAYQIGVWGSSAGGHLSALVGTSGNIKEFELGDGSDVSASSVQAVCDWFGPTDLLKMNEQAGKDGVLNHDSKDSPESKLIGGPIQKNREKANSINPIKYISKDDPPFLIMHGENDRLVPVQQSQMLHDALKRADVDSTLMIIKNAGHGNGFDRNTLHPKIAAFFKQHLIK